jgi:DMSO/TMAO reductase YedYZ molybdopterin-dependent catalytic subunit/cytochrome b561
VTARGTDWGLAALIASLIATGALTLFAGGSSDAWVFDVHDALGFAIAVLLAVKLVRVWPRITARARVERRTAGLVAAFLALAALASGLLWAAGADVSIGGYSLLSWHDALGVALVVGVAIHMVLRAKPLRRRDLADRRQFLMSLGIGAGALIAWRVQRPFESLVRLRGAKRRFTGSYEVASFAGNAFPSTSWVADDPRPIELGSYRLELGGLLRSAHAVPLTDLVGADELIATLDCTGGFYSTQRWRGVRLDRLLERVGVLSSASHLRVVSRTGYRWSFALSDARSLLLATHVGGEPLSHDHGAPVRLVVPGARGYQWVKWVQRIELLDAPDYSAPASTVWSSFTRAGRGDA